MVGWLRHRFMRHYIEAVYIKTELGDVGDGEISGVTYEHLIVDNPR